jgi:hypothetical protein
MVKDAFRKSGADLETTLGDMVAAYTHANAFVEFENPHDWNSIADTVLKLSQGQRDEWAVRWEDVDAVQNSIALPDTYFHLLDETHDRIFQALKPAYADKNPAEFSFEKRIGFMQKIADAETNFWREKFPDVFHDFKGTQVIPFERDEANGEFQDEFSLWPDPATEGHYYYRVSKIHAGNIAFLSGVAAHEPEHATQLHLQKKVKEGAVLPEPLSVASKIFSVYNHSGVGLFPPSLVFDKENKPYDRLGRAVLAAYLSNGMEVSAFYLGNKVEKTMSSLFPQIDHTGPIYSL